MGYRGWFRKNTVNPEERFWSRLQKTNDCWLWTAKTRQVILAKKNIGIHRAAYQFTYGQIPVDHGLWRCSKSPLCVRPEHLDIFKYDRCGHFQWANHLPKDSTLAKCYKTLDNIKQRCRNPNDPKFSSYGGRGIQALLTFRDIVTLWERDNASVLRQASIDRMDSNGHYTLENCRFIEMSINRKLRRKKNDPANQERLAGHLEEHL